MAYGYYSKQLISLTLISVLGLSACTTPTPSNTSASPTATMSTSELELRKQSAALQRTVLEGTAAGAAAGSALDFLLNRDLSGDQSQKVRSGLKIGAATGFAAGSYVALIQSRYILKERRLNAIKTDLDKNAAEMQTTINVMRNVLAVQRAELADLRLRSASGQASASAMSEEVKQANANLTEMQKAIDGATRRQSEFGETRKLTLVNGGTSAIDPDLAALSAQIAAMKAIANDLSAEL